MTDACCAQPPFTQLVWQPRLLCCVHTLQLPTHSLGVRLERTAVYLGEGGEQSRLLPSQDGAQVRPHILHLLHG